MRAMPFRYKRRSKADLLLNLLDDAVENDTYASVLSTLAAGISAAATRIEQIRSPEIAQFVAEDEGEVIESLLGTAYVLCQTPITAVTQAALRARKQALDVGLEFRAFGCKPPEVRELGDRFDAQYSKVEVLWALANYFKHRDEWPRSTSAEPTDEWRRSTWALRTKSDAARYTLPVLQAVRVEPSSNGNLRAGAKALGITDYATLMLLGDIVACWGHEVRSVTRKAFGR